MKILDKEEYEKWKQEKYKMFINFFNTIFSILSNFCMLLKNFASKMISESTIMLPYDTYRKIINILALENLCKLSLHVSRHGYGIAIRAGHIVNGLVIKSGNAIHFKYNDLAHYEIVKQ